MTKKTNSLEHAKHNHKLHSQLIDGDEFTDWAITTGFYASIKYLEHHLFPGNYICPTENKLKEFRTFSEYIRSNRSLNKANAHRLLENIIRTYIDERDVVHSYQDLKDACFHARYITYNVGTERLKICTDALEIIINYTAKVDTSKPAE